MKFHIFIHHHTTAGLAMNFSAHSMKKHACFELQTMRVALLFFQVWTKNVMHLFETVAIILCMAEWTSADSNKIPNKFHDSKRYIPVWSSIKWFKLHEKKYLRIDMPSDEEGKTRTHTIYLFMKCCIGFKIINNVIFARMDLILIDDVIWIQST